MREIKFRGKRVDNGEWVFGSLRIEGDRAFILSKDQTILIDTPELNSQALGCGIEDRGITNRYEACEYGFNEAIDRFYGYFPEWIEVDPDTVGQYTGLKDKNGVEIYEGDIVHCWGGEYCQGYWEFDYRFEVKFDPEQWPYLTNMEHMEVIGNRWDNPELLGVSK